MTHRPTLQPHRNRLPRGARVSAATRHALRTAARAAHRAARSAASGAALTPARRTAILAVGSLFLVPGALALVAPHVLEGLVAMARHGSEPWLAWGAMALLAGLPLTLAGLPWTPRAHAEIDATVAALAGATLLSDAPRTHAVITDARADWPAPESVPRRAA